MMIIILKKMKLHSVALNLKFLRDILPLGFQFVFFYIMHISAQQLFFVLLINVPQSDDMLSRSQGDASCC